MAKQYFNYYNKSWDTKLLPEDEIMVYKYDDFFDNSIHIEFTERDIYDNSTNEFDFELDKGMIVNDLYYPDHYKEIIWDMVQERKCKIVIVNDCMIRTDIYSVYDIQLFVEIMQYSSEVLIPIEFYFGDYGDTIKDVTKLFCINC